jgi:exodeoxyribonuclease VII small subunit
MSLHQPGAGSIAAATDPPRLSQVLARLEEIRRELDRDDLDLEDQLALYREGCGHVITAKRILGDVRSEVEILTQEADAVETRGAEV